MTIDDAQQDLVRYRDAALTIHAKALLARGMSVDEDAFRASLLEYAAALESWRRDALDRLRMIVNAASEPPPSAALN
jgi:hypothetical protein